MDIKQLLIELRQARSRVTELETIIRNELKSMEEELGLIQDKNSLTNNTVNGKIRKGQLLPFFQSRPEEDFSVSDIMTALSLDKTRANSMFVAQKLVYLYQRSHLCRTTRGRYKAITNNGSSMDSFNKMIGFDKHVDELQEQTEQN